MTFSKKENDSVVAYGTHDKVQPYRASLRLKTALEKNGVDFRHFELPHSGHGLQNDSKIKKAMDAFSASMAESPPLLHHFYKPEHLVGTFIGIMFFIFGHIAFQLKIFTPELIDLKSAFIDIKMNITFLEIGCASLPNHRFGMQGFNRLPCAIADTFTVFAKLHHSTVFECPLIIQMNRGNTKQVILEVAFREESIKQTHTYEKRNYKQSGFSCRILDVNCC